jgi:hypothetical protein
MSDKFYRSPEGQGDLTEANSLLENGKKGDTVDDERLAAIITAQERAANSFSRSNLSAQRANALKYYLGDPFGNEMEGRSQVVSTDVFEAVEGMLPSLLEIFLASNKLAECEAYGPEDDAEAKQQTEVANHIIFKQNNAALIFYTWFKDALIQKTGVVKTYYETEDESRIEQWAQLTQEELHRIAGEDNVEPLEYWEDQPITLIQEGQPIEVPTFGLKARVMTKRDKVCIKNIPPENFLVSVRHASLDLNECEFACHKERKTHTDLLEMGVEPEFLEDVGDDDSGVEFTEEAIARDIYSETVNRDPHQEDPSMREYWVSDGTIMVDTDGDGVAELRHFIKIGNKVWLNEETDSVPFSVLCPILLPHQFYGLSVADITGDIQRTKSTLWREMLDNLYLTNRPRTAVVNGQVELDDLLTARPGGIVRMNAPGMATPMETPFVARESFSMVEYLDSVRENRTGVTRYNQGTDADSLNKTAHGIQSILGQSMKRLEMIARLFAETGIKDLVRKVLHCVAKSGMKQVIVKLTNGYVPIDPREWKNQYNITVTVGLGTGTKDALIQKLMMVGAKQLELKQTGRGYLVTEQNDYALATKLAEAAGFKNPELFFTDPRMVPDQLKQPPPPIDILKLQHDEKMKTLDMQVTSQQKDKDMANDRWIAAMQAQKQQETQIAVAKIGQQAQETVANISSDTQKRTKMADAMLEDHKMRGDAEMEVFRANQEQQKPIDAAEAMTKSMDQYMQQLIQAVVQGNEQTSQGLQVVAQEIQGLKQMMLAPRKKVKDRAGKTVGMEIEGYGTVQVQ